MNDGDIYQDLENCSSTSETLSQKSNSEHEEIVDNADDMEEKSENEDDTGKEELHVADGSSVEVSQIEAAMKKMRIRTMQNKMWMDNIGPNRGMYF